MSASVISGCDTSPVFEFREHIFDFVSLFIEGFIVGNESFAVLLWRGSIL